MTTKKTIEETLKSAVGELALLKYYMEHKDWNSMPISFSMYKLLSDVQSLVKFTFDVHFNDTEHSNSKGFEKSIQYCRDYIEMHYASDYFADYKGGQVSIVCNETGETIESYSIPK